MPRTASRAQTLSANLLAQCHALLDQLTTFQNYLADSLGRPHLVELRQFKSAVQSELKSLERSCEQANKAAEEESETSDIRPGETENEDTSESEGGTLGPSERKVLHALRSSNLPFYCMVWTVAINACTGLVGFSKKFYWEETKVEKQRNIDEAFGTLHLSNGHSEERADERKIAQPVTQRKNVIVDIVADHGEEWVKVSTVTPTRLLFELARQGWELDSDEDEDEGYRLQNYDSDDEDIIELVKLATDMRKAAAQTRIRYKHPRIRFILPKIAEGETAPIDKAIREIRKTGVIVECGGIQNETAIQNVKDWGRTSPQLAFSALIPSPYPHRTPILNVDCTLLLALVSDLSHCRGIVSSPHHHRAIARQIELETEKPLVPSELWPAMADKDLICTDEAAHRMREIVDTIGTPSEKRRTQLLMGDVEGVERSTLITEFQALTEYDVPKEWRIPIKVVKARDKIDTALKNGQLPSVAFKVVDQLSDINTSVFLYGWVSGLLTISSNKTVTKQIESIIEENRGDDDDLAGPYIWVCDTARSLVGKEKGRKG